MIGKTIQNIEITSLLGKGGMGTVYKGTDVMLQRDVAIKVLHPELLYDDQVTKRFQSEAIMLASLNHTNITSLFNLIKSEGNFMMVMEFVDGRSLEDMLQERKRFSEDEAIAYIQQALEGLKHAHEKNIIHRDMKLANIMVSNEGIVKVMDFGIARVLGSSRLTSSGRVIGTLEYMSPEQVRGEEGDERSDIYAIGTVLYEMVAGRVPFKSASDYDLMTTKLNQKPPSIRSFVETNSALDTILSKAMNTDPKHRYQTAEQFRQALDDYQKKYLLKPTKPRQKSFSAAALLKTKGSQAISENTKATSNKQSLNNLPGFLIDKFTHNRKIIIQAAAAIVCCALLFGVALKIRKTRFDGRSSANNEILVDSQNLQNVENSQAGQNSMIYPETPKIDPTTLPGYDGADQGQEENKDNSERKSENEGGNKKPKAEPSEKVRIRSSDKTEEKKEERTSTEKNKITEPDKSAEEQEAEKKTDGKSEEESKIEEDSTDNIDIGEKVEAVTDKINQTGKKLLKDFKEILLLDEEDEEKAKDDEKEKVEEKKKEPQTVYIQAYTTIYVRLSEAVSSENAKSGQKVVLTIDKDVIVDGLLAIRAGQLLNGTISDVKSSGGSRKGMIELNISALNIPGSQPVPLRASTFRIMGEKDQDAIILKGQTFEVQTAQRSKIIVGG